MGGLLGYSSVNSIVSLKVPGTREEKSIFKEVASQSVAIHVKFRYNSGQLQQEDLKPLSLVENVCMRGCNNYPWQDSH